MRVLSTQNEHRETTKNIMWTRESQRENDLIVLLISTCYIILHARGGEKVICERFSTVILFLK
jgi:hypothetical protein